MKSRKHISMAVYITVLVVFSVTFCNGCNEKLKYDVWKDSHEAFGDGEYQLMHTLKYKGKENYCLYNCRVGLEIMHAVEKYKQCDSMLYCEGILRSDVPIPMHISVDLESSSITLYAPDQVLSSEANMLTSYLKLFEGEIDILVESETNWNSSIILDDPYKD